MYCQVVNAITPGSHLVHRVRLHGLSKPSLNGCTGVVTSALQEGRLIVKLSSGAWAYTPHGACGPCLLQNSSAAHYAHLAAGPAAAEHTEGIKVRLRNLLPLKADDSPAVRGCQYQRMAWHDMHAESRRRTFTHWLTL